MLSIHSNLFNHGQASVQLGDSVCRQHCSKHNLLANAKNLDTSDNGSHGCFFEESNGASFVSRNLSIDFEPNMIDDIRMIR